MLADTAAYLRARALVCLRMARQMSDLNDKARLEQQAKDYTLRAEQFEETAPPGKAAGRKFSQ